MGGPRTAYAPVRPESNTLWKLPLVLLGNKMDPPGLTEETIGDIDHSVLTRTIDANWLSTQHVSCSESTLPAMIYHSGVTYIYLHVYGLPVDIEFHLERTEFRRF